MISFNMLMNTLFTKTSFFSQFSKEMTRFFHNFQKKRHNFSQLVWYRTLSQFWKKNAEFWTSFCLKCIAYVLEHGAADWSDQGSAAV